MIYKELLMGNELITQQNMHDEFNIHHNITPFNIEPTKVTQFKIPSHSSCCGSSAIVVKLDEVKNSYKSRLILSAFSTASYLLFCSGKGSNSHMSHLSSYLPKLVAFMNEHRLEEQDLINVFTKFESYRVNNDKVKPQSTGVKELIGLINLSLSYRNFYERLNLSDYNFLDKLTKTHIARSTDAVQKTLSNYFGYHSWLGRKDLGVGHQLYQRAGSATALMASFKITMSTALIEILGAKNALIDLFKIKRNDFEELPVFTASRPSKLKYDDGAKSAEYKKAVANYKKEVINYKQKFFLWLSLIYQSTELTLELELAIDAIIFAECSAEAYGYVKKQFKNHKAISQQIKVDERRVTVFNQQLDSSLLFNIDFVLSLYNFVNSGNPKPISRAEEYIFINLMSYQTVAGSDIFKLTLKNFKLFRNQKGKIYSIGCDYFKTRANREHTVDYIDTRTLLGEAVKKYLEDKTDGFEDKEIRLVLQRDSLQPKSGRHSSGSVFYSFLSNSTLNEVICNQLAKNEASPVFHKCMGLICSKGIKKENSATGDFNTECKTPTVTRLFSQQAVKNSRIHSDSKSFDPRKLFNFHSHSSSTEQKDYLSEYNEEYQNNCGQITRLVMHDLQLNVLHPSKQEIAFFNQQYERASEVVTERRNDVLARLKIVTGIDESETDSLGVVSNHKNSFLKNDLPDTIYLVDSPETVLKMKHYLSQLEKYHRQMFEHSPEFLFYEALPTAEWIEKLFVERKFSNTSVEKGEEYFHRFKNKLPSLFAINTGVAK